MASGGASDVGKALIALLGDDEEVKGKARDDAEALGRQGLLWEGSLAEASTALRVLRAMGSKSATERLGIFNKRAKAVASDHLVSPCSPLSIVIRQSDGSRLGFAPDGTGPCMLEPSWMYALERGLKLTAEMPDFDYAGELRPHPISPRREVPAGISKPDYADDPNGLAHAEIEANRTRAIKEYSPAEIEGVRAACHLARRALDQVARSVDEGVTTDYLDWVCHDVITGGGGYPSPLNYFGFPKSCCTSVNEVVCHGIPDARPLQRGDIVNVDVTAYLNRYHGDLNETFVVGETDEAAKNLIRGSLASLNAGIAAAKPDARYRDIGPSIQKAAHSFGLSVVKQYCGHGVGEHFHCAPTVPHYKNNKAVGTLKPGHIFTLEPMVSEGSWGTRTWPDSWTATTEDGSRSAQFEHTLLVTPGGVERLTDRLPDSPSVFPFSERY